MLCALDDCHGERERHAKGCDPAGARPRRAFAAFENNYESVTAAPVAARAALEIPRPLAETDQSEVASIG